MRLREAHRGDISAEQIEVFFATLADTCNVVRSARAAGFSSNWAYRKRKTDAAFRNGWAMGVREGYAKLELVLLERAMKGTTKPIFRRDGTELIIRQYSTALAVALLRRHAATADDALDEPGAEEANEARERILAKLERLRARDGAVEKAAVEIKSAVDRVALIIWGLKRACADPSPSPTFQRCSAPLEPSGRLRPRSPLASRPLPLAGEGCLR